MDYDSNKSKFSNWHNPKFKRTLSVNDWCPHLRLFHTLNGLFTCLGTFFHTSHHARRSQYARSTNSWLFKSLFSNPSFEENCIILCYETAFSKRMWHKVKVLPCPWAFWLLLATDQTIQMRYVMCLNSQWFRNDQPSKYESTMKERPFSLLKPYFQIWWLIIPEPLWVQACYIPQLKGLARIDH